MDLVVKAEPMAIKQDNAGRNWANDWIREEKFNYPTTIEEKYND